MMFAPPVDARARVPNELIANSRGRGARRARPSRTSHGLTTSRTRWARCSALVKEEPSFCQKKSLIRTTSDVFRCPLLGIPIFAVRVTPPGPNACRKPPTFQVDEISDVVYASYGDLRSQGYVAKSRFSNGLSFFYLGVENPPKYKNIPMLTGYLAKSGKVKKPSCRFSINLAQCETQSFPIPTGFFNFLEAIIQRDQYTYALFPKAEVAGFLAARSIDAGGDIGIPTGGASTDASIAFRRNREEAQTVPRSIGFSDSRIGADATGADEPRSVNFGWVIGGGEQLRATQKSGFALVSVPAWTNELSVTVQTGWLTAQGMEVSRGDPYQIIVPIPPDYEALDAVVTAGGALRHEPRIMDVLMGKPHDPTGGQLDPADPTKRSDVTVTACQNASIVIPGYRLWRSTVVTLGGQKADRITVLPNMRGIMAEFQRVKRSPFPNEWEWLQVWTSEGVDTATTPIKVLPPARSRGLWQPYRHRACSALAPRRWLDAGAATSAERMARSLGDNRARRLAAHASTSDRLRIDVTHTDRRRAMRAQRLLCQSR